MSAPERLPEHPYQLGIHHIEAAIEALRHAAEANAKDKPLYLRRADEHVRYARDGARSVAARWREYNQRAADLGAWIEDAEVGESR